MFNKMIKLSLAIICILHIQSSLAFNGYIEYEVTTASMPLTKKVLKVGMKQQLMRFDLFKLDRSKKRDVISNTVINFKEQKLQFQDETSNLKIDLTTSNKTKIPTSEEVVTLKSPPLKILDYNLVKHELFYVVDTKRIPVTLWFPNALQHEFFRTTNHLFELNPFLFQLNYLFHPFTKQIALNMTCKQVDGDEVNLNAIKIVNEILADEYFKLEPIKI